MTNFHGDEESHEVLLQQQEDITRNAIITSRSRRIMSCINIYHEMIMSPREAGVVKDILFFLSLSSLIFTVGFLLFRNQGFSVAFFQLKEALSSQQ